MKLMKRVNDLIYLHVLDAWYVLSFERCANCVDWQAARVFS
jgi:hypothetical protein